jgi:hypothetical protein
MTPVHLYASTFSTLELTRSMKQALPVHAKAAGRVSDIGRSVAAAEIDHIPDSRIHVLEDPGAAARWWPAFLVARRQKWLPAAT